MGRKSGEVQKGVVLSQKKSRMIQGGKVDMDPGFGFAGVTLAELSMRKEGGAYPW